MTSRRSYDVDNDFETLPNKHKRSPSKRHSRPISTMSDSQTRLNKASTQQDKNNFETRSITGTLKRALGGTKKTKLKSSTPSRTNDKLRVADVTPGIEVYDDVTSMISAYVPDVSTAAHREDGIRDTFGRKGVITLRKVVKLLDTNSKYNTKILLLTPYRCQIFSTTHPFKMEHEFHFLNILSLDSRNQDCLIVTLKSGKTHTMVMIGSDDSDQIIGRIAETCKKIFPTIPLSRIFRASLEPVSRLKSIQQVIYEVEQMEVGACGNFSEQYRCICDFMGVVPKEEVQWDIDTIYLTQQIREINLKDFDFTYSKDLAPIVAVIMYNDWFTKLTVKDMKLTTELIDLILKVVRNSKVLKQLVLNNVGVRYDFVQKLARCLMDNSHCGLELIDLSNNNIEDRGAIFLSGPLPMMKAGKLTSLVLSKTGISSKGLNGLCQSLRSNEDVLRTLTHLDFSKNTFKSDEVDGLYNLLSKDNMIEDINLSATSSAVEVYIGAFSKGCLQHLKRANLSENHFFPNKRSTNITSGSRPHFVEDKSSSFRRDKSNGLPFSFQKFFEDTSALEYLNFSKTKLPSEALRAMLTGLSSNTNENLKIHLDISDCELKEPGSQVLQQFISSIKSIKTLDISGNSLDYSLVDLLPCIQNNTSLRKLNLGRNFSGIKHKRMKDAVESVVELVQDENSKISSLSLRDSKIKDFLQMFLGCLGSNTSLEEIDLSGNGMGDIGAKVLAKSLQINAKITRLYIDKNQITNLGYKEIAASLKNNYMLKFLPYPVNDVLATIKQHPERTQKSLATIQDRLLQNANIAHSDKSTTSEPQFRLRKALTSMGQNVLEKMTEKTEHTINALEVFASDDLYDDSFAVEIISNAKKLVNDAKNTKNLLSEMYEIGINKCEKADSSLQTKIREVAKTIDLDVQKHLQETTKSMTSYASQKCPNTFKLVTEDLEQFLSTNSKLQDNVIEDYIIKTAGGEITNKVGNLNLQIGIEISNKITDTLLAEISQCNILLTDLLQKTKEECHTKGYSKLDRSKRTDEDTCLKPKSVSPVEEAARERVESLNKRQRRPVEDIVTKVEGFIDNDLNVLDDEKNNKSLDKDISSTTTEGSFDIPVTPEDKSICTQFDPTEEFLKSDEISPDNTEINNELEIKDSEKTVDLNINTSINKNLEIKMDSEVVNDKTEKSENLNSITNENKIDETDKDQKETQIANIEANTLKHSESISEQKAELKEVDESSDTKISEKKCTDKKTNEDEVSDIVDELPPMEAPSRLQHLTKGRPRGPSRKRASRKSSRKVSQKPLSEEKVDDFFEKSVSSTDFSQVLTVEEVKKKEVKEKMQNKMKKMGVGLMGAPGLGIGGMGLTPDMLKLKKRGGSLKPKSQSSSVKPSDGGIKKDKVLKKSSTIDVSDLPPPPSMESDTPNSPGQVFRNSPKTPKEKSGTPNRFTLPPHSIEMPSNFLAELKRTKKSSLRRSSSRSSEGNENKE